MRRAQKHNTEQKEEEISECQELKATHHKKRQIKYLINKSISI